MVLSGYLSDFSLADVLQLISQQKKTGTLEMIDGKSTALIYISQGNITGIRVGTDTPEDKIRQLLLEQKVMNPSEYEELLEVSRGMNRPVLSTLVSKGYIGADVGEKWIRHAAEDMVSELFSWRQGRYEFSTGNKNQDSALSPVNISTDFACMEGMRRLDEWPRLKEIVTSEQIVFRRISEDYHNYDLGDEKLLLEAIDGQKTIQQLEREVPFGYFRIYDSIVNFWNEGFIEPVGRVKLESPEVVRTESQSETDRLTAMVLGLSSLFLILGLCFRFLLGSIAGTANIFTTNYVKDVKGKLGQQNVENFIVEKLIYQGQLPRSLGTLVEQAALSKSELRSASGRKYFYEPINELDFNLK